MKKNQRTTRTILSLLLSLALLFSVGVPAVAESVSDSFEEIEAVGEVAEDTPRDAPNEAVTLIPSEGIIPDQPGISTFSVGAPITVVYRSTGHTSGSVPANQSNSTTPFAFELRNQGTLARTNFRFDGWRYSNGQIYQPGQRINFTTGGTATFEAVWTSTGSGGGSTNTSVTITYRSSGHTSGSIPTSHSVNTPGSATMKQHNLARTGFTFGGWQSSSSGNIFQPNQSVSFTGSGTIFYDAVWTSTGGGSGSGANRTLSVSRQSQQQNYWCWAAVASMLTNYEGVGRTQTQLVTSLAGWADPNQTANMGSITNLLRSTSSRFANAQVIVRPSFQAIANQIINGKPVPLTAWSGSGIAHMYLVYAVEDISVYMHDPWSTQSSFSNTRISSSQLITGGWYSPALGKTVIVENIASY
jgi:hypothetical protein